MSHLFAMAMISVSGLTGTVAADYGGTNYGTELVNDHVPTEVLLQADSRSELEAMIRNQQIVNLDDVNRMIGDSPTAAGSETQTINTETKIIETQVIDECNYSVNGVACSTKSVFQLVR